MDFFDFSEKTQKLIGSHLLVVLGAMIVEVCIYIGIIILLIRYCCPPRRIPDHVIHPTIINSQRQTLPVVTEDIRVRDRPIDRSKLYREWHTHPQNPVLTHKPLSEDDSRSDIPFSDIPISDNRSSTLATFASSYERRTAIVLRRLFPNHEFRKVRPNWLANDYPGRRHPIQNLELDFYCGELFLAVEVQGQGHNQHVEAWRRPNGKSPLIGQQFRDKKKRELCKARGVDLVEVWYHEDIETVLDNNPLILKAIRRAQKQSPS